MSLPLFTPLRGNVALDDVPYYGIYVHFEPHHYASELGLPSEDFLLKGDYMILLTYLWWADYYNVKLTLMISPQAAGWIARTPWAKEIIVAVAAKGHEIAMHHHALASKVAWDGYTDLDSWLAQYIRASKVTFPEPYIGSLTTMMNLINQSLEANVRSGCPNEEGDKWNMPDNIIYSMSSGYANFGPPAQYSMNDFSPEKGRNEYVLVGDVRGIVRYWVGASKVDSIEDWERCVQVIKKTRSDQLYNIVVHNLKSNYDKSMPAFLAALRYFHTHDPSGSKNRTLIGAVENTGLPFMWADIPERNDAIELQ